MRIYPALLGLLVLCACGDDESDIAGPDDGFTLTVTGQGNGSGRAVSAPGTNPAIDCTVVAGEPAGTCSAKYSQGTTVALTAVADEGSSFTGWDGDALGCTEASCSITMSADRSVVVEFTGAASPEAVQITSSAWYPEPDFGGEGFGAVVWLVEVQNTSSQVVELAQIDFVSRDAQGNVLASDFVFVGPIPPGESRANESLADYLGTEASADFQIGEVQFGTEDPELGVAQIVSSNWREDPTAGETGGIVWTVEVQNTGTEVIEATVDFATYDANGQILEYDFTFVGPISPGATAVGEGLADLRGTVANVSYKVSGVSFVDGFVMP
ncbi:MAG TPA: hypothetical protein VHH32_01500 [Gemmatimonadales bacterium]|nr:hypothetical protein [Gemmatimonadales bacterium]